MTAPADLSTVNVETPSGGSERKRERERERAARQAE
jgi:hypothetical protein